MRRKKGTGIGIISFVVLFICGIVAYGKVNLEKQKNTLSADKAQLESQLKEESDRAIDIRNYEAYVQTKKYIEEIAREKLGLVYEHEILFERVE